MEKKNINIGVVRICTILLLTVFTIGRKYGEEQNAEKLINDLKQQTCACCLNFEEGDALAQAIDVVKQGLEGEIQKKNEEIQKKNEEIQKKNEEILKKNEEILKKNEDNNQLRNKNENLQNDKYNLQTQIGDLKNEIGKKVWAGKIAENVQEPLNKLDNRLNEYNNKLNEYNNLNQKLKQEIEKISTEKEQFKKDLDNISIELKKKEGELKTANQNIEVIKKEKEEIILKLSIANNEIKGYNDKNINLTTDKQQLEEKIKEFEDEKKKNEENYNSIRSNYENVVEKNTQQINEINNLLITWNNNNEKLNLDINNKKEKINELNKEIEKNKFNIGNLNKEIEELNTKYNNLNRAHEKLEQSYKKIEQEKRDLEDTLKACEGQVKYLTEQTSTLNDILKNTKTNVNMEEYASLYNSINAQKRTNISILLNRDVETFPQKQYTFYIPFKFKDYGQCAIKKTISDIFTKNPGIYTTNLSLYDILRSFFEIKAFEKFKELKIIKVTNLKEIYFDVSFPYEGDKIKIEGKGMNVEENRTKAIELPKIVTSPKTQGNANFNRRNEIKEFTNYDKVADGTAYEKCMNRFFLDYSNLIELVGIDEYLNKRGDGKIEDEKNKIEEKEDLFLLELDFKDPECIALLESVGKGNYGVVKKGLTFENGKLVTKAIKFTCSNSDFENSKEENILKEIRAGKIVNEIGVGNKIAFVQDYMKIKNFKKRYDYKKEEEKKIEIVPLKEETEDGNLTNAVYTTFLNDNLETLPKEKKNVSEDFKNNVFSKKGKIGDNLYIMFLDLVNGNDLFLKEKKEELDINKLGDMLFDVLKNLYVCGVALKDIKPKNIMWDDQKKEFSIIDVQTLGMKGSNLADCCGTPELWPFFKTLNLNLNIKDEIKDEDKKEDLYDRFCYSIDDNFVDIYAACMTMYFAKFSTYTAAGLLTLLLKWLVLDKENKDKKGWETFSLNDKIEFLKKYNDNYKKYINFVNRKENKEPINKNLEDSCRKKQKKIKNKKNVNKINTKEDECSDIIKFFFENIDDKNLNKEQKNVLADLLKKVITTENGSNIFYLLNEIKDELSKDMKINGNENENKNININGNEYPQIIKFYEDCVKEDFDNFAKLSDKNCKYADVIKYVLCYGSCLNYNGEKDKMEVNTILEQLKLKENLEINDEAFFNDTDKVIKDVIDNLQSGFNQKFIIELLGILPLEEYNEILEHDVNKGSVDYYFKRKIDSLKEEEKEKKDKIEKQKKVFYLLRYLEINKLFHIPKNILKINSLIDKNTNNKLVGKKNIDKK